MENETGKKTDKIGNFGSQDNRPLWVIYFDRAVWVIMIVAMIWWGYNYFFGFTQVTIYDCTGNVKLSDGKVKTWTLNLSALEEKGYKVIQEQKGYIDKINKINLTDDGVQIGK